MKRLLFLVLVAVVAFAFPLQAQNTVSVLDLAPNYGLPSSYFRDTNVFIQRLNSRSSSATEKANSCATYCAKAKDLLYYLRKVCQLRGGQLYVDAQTVVSDFDIYEIPLTQFVACAERLRKSYIAGGAPTGSDVTEAVNSMDPEAAEEEQSLRNHTIEQLKKKIVDDHNLIDTRCNGLFPLNYPTQSERQSIYYAYLAIYNKIDFTAPNTPQQEVALRGVYEMQEDILANILSDTNYYYQIVAFPDVLRQRAVGNNTDVYRSYNRSFKQTSVLIAFNTVQGYWDFSHKLAAIVATQRSYLSVLDYRDTIGGLSRQIVQRYTPRYKHFAQSYLYAEKNVTVSPSYGTYDESVHFINQMQEFVSAQRSYLAFYPQIEDLRRERELLLETCPKSCTDLRTAYRRYPDVESMVPSFYNVAGATEYGNQLAAYHEYSAKFDTLIRMRSKIEERQTIITSSTKAERAFVKGYLNLRDQYSFSLRLDTPEDLDTALRGIKDFSDIQDYCLEVLHCSDSVVDQHNYIMHFSNGLKSITRDYRTICDEYSYRGTIESVEDMRQYYYQLLQILQMQQQFILVIKSKTCTEFNHRLSGSETPEQIRTIFHL